jgi:predicted NAD/FAD-dependent oxidoreductase
LEKSRGVGGRLATRRTANGKFDHGAQFYSLKPPLRSLHERWREKNLVRRWFEKNETTRFASPAGMTALAKDLATELDVRLDTRVTSVRSATRGWQLELESGVRWTGRTVVLTCPLPQALELLQAGGVGFDPALSTVPYAMALVALYEGVRGAVLLSEPDGYGEGLRPAVASVSDQSRKGLSLDGASGQRNLTVVMAPEFSAQYFAQTDAEALDAIRRELLAFDPGFGADTESLKRWRYAHPLTIWPTPFAELAPGLYLAGDAFGGASLNGAATSARALAERLLR